jgi:hypothetical protein
VKEDQHGRGDCSAGLQGNAEQTTPLEWCSYHYIYTPVSRFKNS